MSNAIINNNLNNAQTELIEDFIQPMLIHYALVEYYPFANYQIKNGGIFKHNSETATSADKSEVDYLIAKSRGIAEYYTRRFIEYMQYNQHKFPSYNQQTDDDIYPDKDSLFNGWVLWVKQKKEIANPKTRILLN